MLLSVYPPISARQRLSKYFPVAVNTPGNERIVGCHFLCSPCLIKGKSVCMYVPLIAARQHLGKHFPTATKNFWMHRFCVLPRTLCYTV
jgi:hypothetical protein